jgi:predicted regulator of Ras-like GTPase activity (Roadblock/LC7/MglB family)
MEMARRHYVPGDPITAEEPMTTSLPGPMDGWSSRSTIRGAAIVSEDGLLVHDALPVSSDREAVAALVLPLMEHGRQLSQAAGGGRLETVVLELEGGPAIVSPVDERHTLVVLAEPDRDIGGLLFEIRTDRATLAQAI